MCWGNMGIAVNDLSILPPHFPHLLLDARTHLQIPKKVNIHIVPPGEYSHFGFGYAIEQLLKCSQKCQKLNLIELCVNVDGSPISKSSGSQLYPILVNLYQDKNCVELIGLYHGNEKPADAYQFLSAFVCEVKNVLNGLIFKDKLYTVRIRGFILDVPAKSYITYVKGHSGYMSHTKCYTDGDFINNRVCFPTIKKGSGGASFGYISA